MRNFKSLMVWEKAHQLTMTIYKVSNNFPKEEVYGLTSQIRRASSSVPINISEGCAGEVVLILLAFYKSPLVQQVKRSIYYFCVSS